MKLIDLTGMAVGELTVLNRAENNKHGHTRWNCRCSCGKIYAVEGNCLKRENPTRSCGHLAIRHGVFINNPKGTPEYSAWGNMRNRCFNPKNQAYADYGGRGITVCERWNKFENFLADMGPRPHPKYSLDRYPNNNGNYEPGNCRWTTKSEQNKNTRKHRAIENFSDEELFAEVKRRSQAGA